MSNVNQDAFDHFFKTGTQYYVAGRAAAQCHLMPVAGNLLHHAVEMLLKGDLSRTVPLEELKNRKKFGHDLLKAWNAFKALHSTEALNEFDQLITELDRFEKIRYPDEYIKYGAAMSLSWGGVKARVKGGRQLPNYCIWMPELDVVIARLFKVSKINPKAYSASLHPKATELLQHENKQWELWRP